MSIPLAALEEIIDTSGIAPRVEALLPDRGAPPAAAGPHPAGRDAADPGRSPARAPDPGPRRADRPARAGPGPARRDRGLEDRPAPAHLPADRAHLRPGHRRPGQGQSPTGPRRRSSPRICDDLLEASIPGEYKQASRALAVDWTDVETFSRPPPHGTSDCADPEASWGHRSGGGPGQDSELFFGYYLSAATMMREEHGPPVPELARRMTVVLLPCRPGPRPGPGADPDARGRHPARRHPGRLRLRPPRRRGLGHPAPPGRGAAGPGPAPLRPRPPRHPRRRHHRQRQPVLPGHPPHAAGTRARWPATPPRPRPPRTTPRPPSSPATSSAGSPPTTPTATTGSCAPPSWARSAARCARPR